MCTIHIVVCIRRELSVSALNWSGEDALRSGWEWLMLHPRAPAINNLGVQEYYLCIRNYECRLTDAPTSPAESDRFSMSCDSRKELKCPDFTSLKSS